MTLQKKLILPLLIILTIPLAVISVMTYRYLLDFTSNNLLTNANELAASITPSLNQNFKTVENNLHLFSSNRFFQDYISRGDERFDLMQMGILKQFGNYQDVHPEYVSIKLVMENGEIDSAMDSRSDAEFLFDIRDWPIYQNLYESSDNAMQTQLDKQEDGTYIMHFGISVKSTPQFAEAHQAEGQKRMFIVLSKVLKHAKNTIMSVNPNDGHIVFMTDMSETIVFANKEDIEGGSIDYAETKAVGDGFILADVDNKAYYLFCVELTHEFSLYVGLPKFKFNQAVDQLALTMFLLTAVIIAVIFAFCLIYIRQVLLYPIYANKSLVEDITKGKMDTPLTRKLCNDELSLLTKSILTMRDTIVNNQTNIQQLAYFDTLTGLPNRFTFQQELATAVTDSLESQHPFALVFLDLDNFKYVNDNLGHDIGDELLKVVSKRIRQNLRIQDYVVQSNAFSGTQRSLVARIGGDEFTLILKDFTAIDGFHVPLTRLIHALQAPIQIQGHSMHVGASLGVAIYPEHASNENDLLKCADVAMYEAKRRGKNCYVVYEEEFKEALLA